MTLFRKAREALITRLLENHLAKERILELYLNVAEWGQGVFGAEAAARHHFGKSAKELTLDEAALLAAILPSPRRYDPIRHTAYLNRRQHHIIRWLERGSGRRPVSLSRQAAHRTREILSLLKTEPRLSRHAGRQTARLRLLGIPDCREISFPENR